MAAHREWRETRESCRPRSPRRPRPGLRHCRDDCGIARDHGIEHRLLHGRRGAFHRFVRHRAFDARGDGSRAGYETRMILGIGSDLIDIRRVAKVIERHGDRFLDRIFTDAERARAARRAKSEKMVVATYAKRFAAKEACSKALGTGIRQGVWWRDMGVVNLPGGRPTMQLTGGALARLKARTPEGHEARIDLSITDDWPLAQAFVIISAVNPGKA